MCVTAQHGGVPPLSIRGGCPRGTIRGGCPRGTIRGLLHYVPLGFAVTKHFCRGFRPIRRLRAALGRFFFDRKNASQALPDKGRWHGVSRDGGGYIAIHSTKQKTGCEAYLSHCPQGRPRSESPLRTPIEFASLNKKAGCETYSSSRPLGHTRHQRNSMKGR